MKPEGITYYTPAERHDNGIWSYNIEKKFMDPSFVPEIGEVIRFGGEKGANDYAIVYDREIIATTDRHLIELYCERVVGKYDRRPRKWFLDKVNGNDQDILMEVLAMSDDFKAKEIREIETEYELDGETIDT